MKSPRLRDILITVAVLAVCWQFLALLLDHQVVPGLERIGATFFAELRGPLLLHALVSLGRVLCAIGVSIALGCPVGILLAQNRTANRFLSPAVYLFYPVPKVVFVPLILLWFGVGNVPKIVLISLVLVNQMVVLVRDSVKGIPAELIDSVRSLGARRGALLRFVFLPASLPAVLTSLRQSIGTAFAVLYIAELFATKYGLGYYIRLNGSVLFNYPAMYAGIFVMAALGLALFLGVDRLEKHLCPHIAVT